MRKLFKGGNYEEIRYSSCQQQFGIQNGGKVLLWNQVKYRMEACYSELVLSTIIKLILKNIVKTRVEI